MYKVEEWKFVSSAERQQLLPDAAFFWSNAPLGKTVWDLFAAAPLCKYYFKAKVTYCLSGCLILWFQIKMFCREKRSMFYLFQTLWAPAIKCKLIENKCWVRIDCHLLARSHLLVYSNGGTCITFTPRTTSLHVFSYLIYKVSKE